MRQLPIFNGRFFGLACLGMVAIALCADPLTYAPAPPDNPLKGFVPYLGKRSEFPHSLEWDYTAVSELMPGPGQFDWQPFEAKLRAAASRGHQFIARFYLEWPGRKTGVPQYLIDAGLTLRRWTNTNTQPFPPAVDYTPDYEDPRLREALRQFISALGARYDGDPRLGFVGLGLLGSWGEWHTHPNNHWFASKAVQREVLDAYEIAFRRTRLLARYPAGPDDPVYADNSRRPVGYHDDSFAWATVHTGEERKSWFFESRLRRADAQEKWRWQPVGGEVRPEVWDCLFDDPSCAPEGQEFLRCVRTVHPSWLANEGVFRRRLDDASRQRALRAAQQLGYELSVTDAVQVVSRGGEELLVTLSVTNTGVAPFYYDWSVELGACDRLGRLVDTWPTSWRLSEIQPGRPSTLWATRISIQHLRPDRYQLLVRVPNCLPQAAPVRFANATQDRHLDGWLTLGEFERPNPSPPRAEQNESTVPAETVLLHLEFIQSADETPPASPAPEPLQAFIDDHLRATLPAEQASADQLNWPDRFTPPAHLPVQHVVGPGVVGIESNATSDRSGLELLKVTTGFNSWLAPDTRARRDEVCHIRLAESIEIRTGFRPEAVVVRDGRPPELDSPYAVTAVPCGAWLEILVGSRQDEPVLDLQVSAVIIEFSGYTRSARNSRLRVWLDGHPQWLDIPEPELLFREFSGRALIYPGESLVLGSWAADAVGRSETDGSDRWAQQTPRRRPPPLLMVITPELLPE